MNWLDWLFINHFEKFIAGLLILYVFICGMVIYFVDAEQKEFTRDCLQDHKQYECVAMWRRGP